MAEASSAAGAARAVAAGAAAPAPAVVAVDVGGTTVKGAVIDAAGAVVARRVVPTTSPGIDAAASLEGLVADLLAAAAAAGRTACGIGVASPGLVDVRAGVVEYASNLGWRDHPVVTRLQDRFALPAHLEHDARAGLLAERSARRDPVSGALPADLAFVPIGTGISTALVSGGNVLPGATGAAGEFGHAVVVPGGEPCACGLRGCLESYASAAAVGRRFVERGGPVGSTSRDVVARLASDPAARAVWQEAVETLARALAGLVALLDPRLVVVGGGLALAGTTLSVPLAAALEDALPWRRPPELDLSRVGPGAGLVGAALLALEAAGPAAPVPADFHLRVHEERPRLPL